MNELLNGIFNKWKDASAYTDTIIKFVINYTSHAVEFMKLLETWRVPYKVAYDTFRVEITTLNYWDVMRNKEYYSESNISNEIMENYYA